MRSVQKFPTPAAILCGFTLLLVASGCGQDGFVDKRDKVNVVPVTGKILVDGEKTLPPKMIRIILHPDEATKGKMPNDIRYPSGFLTADGTTFNVGTYLRDDGAPAGKYTVTFEVGAMNLMSGNFKGGTLKGKYNDPATSETEVVIAGDESSTDLGLIELTSD